MQITEQGIRRVIISAIQRNAERIFHRSQVYCPVDRGTLRQSGVKENTESGAYIAYRAPYACLVGNSQMIRCKEGYKFLWDIDINQDKVMSENKELKSLETIAGYRINDGSYEIITYRGFYAWLTKNHRVPVFENGYKTVQDLKVGDELFVDTAEGIIPDVIIKLKYKPIDLSIPVYDIEVEGNSTYFLNGILVHNSAVHQGVTEKPIEGRQVVHVHSFQRRDGTVVRAHDKIYDGKRLIPIQVGGKLVIAPTRAGGFAPRVTKRRQIFRVISKISARRPNPFLLKAIREELPHIKEDIAFYLKRYGKVDVK